MQHDTYKLYIAVAIALFIRVISVPYNSLKASVILVGTSLGCTLIFTLPVAEILEVHENENFVIAIAALLTMTAMGLVKWLLAFVDNLPTDAGGIIKLLKDWRSGK